MTEEEDILRMQRGTQDQLDKYKEQTRAAQMERSEKDPWAHRSQGMRCKTCMWFAPKSGDIGRCRRHAPTMNGYPAVYLNDWCGDHKVSGY